MMMEEESPVKLRLSKKLLTKISSSENMIIMIKE